VLNPERAPLVRQLSWRAP